MGSRLPQVPRDMPLNHQAFLTEVKKVVERIAPPDVPPGKPSNLTVRPLPGGNDITFTGGDSADGHLILSSPTRDWNPTKVANHVTDVGLSTHWQHMIGIGGQDHFYWVVALRGNQKTDPPTGPVMGTTLGLAVPAAAPKFVPPVPNLLQSRETGKPTIITTKRGGGRNIL